MNDAHPLRWPDGWIRTRPQDQKPMGSWNRSAKQYRDALEKELTRMKCPAWVITSNVPLNQRQQMALGGIEPRDVGVAVYFTRPTKKDFTWQDALNIHDPDPTEASVQEAFTRLAKLYHPDKPGGDMALFQEAVKHRETAIKWINRHEAKNHDLVIACDTFEAVRLNVAAIAGTIQAIRKIERCGTSALLERAFKGFSALNAAPESVSA